LLSALFAAMSRPSSSLSLLVAVCVVVDAIVVLVAGL